MYKSKPNIVGIGISQVPTNAMLGGLAYQDSVGEINIEKIKARTGDTAADIFVYDTRKDSDGGAWRHRTENLSWYNEGANEFRGARKEFPTVAVIVSTSSNLIIYDGDDPNLSMWMVFNSSGWMNGAMPAALSAKNGIIAVGSNTTNQRLRIVFFLKDHCEDWATANSGGGHRASIGNFLGRNSDSSAGRTIDSTIGIVNRTINDVAMTVLPNAPIDDITGLPVPTIAIATDGGTNIINDDGTVTQGYQTIATEHVDLHPDGFMTDGISGATNDSFSFYKIGTIARLVSYGHRADTQDINTFLNEGTGECLFEGSGNKIAIAQSQGLLRIVEELNASRASDADSSGLHNRTTSSYNTGWMHGDIKSAFLSDTDTTDLTRNNVLTVGTFASASGWTLTDTAAPTITGGKLVFDGTSGNGLAQRAESPAVITSGLQYTVKFTVSDFSAGSIRARVANSGYGPTVSANGTHYHSFVAGGTPTETVLFYGLNFNGKVDDVEIFLEDQERSANKKGLQVFGTIPKQVVATGAELVSYGPFSTLNRLRQYYNSDLNFGTNDFSIMFWVNHDGTDAHQSIVGRDDREFAIFILSNTSYNRKIRVYSFNSSNSLQTFDSAADPFPMNSWNHVCVNYTGGNTATIYINGVLNNSGALDYDIDDTTHHLNIGCRNSGGTMQHPAANCKLALLRISKSAPSADQVKKIYDDEKCLYHENSKCTLYGTSDAVTALGFDDSTDTAYVGTSAGRSEFQGLNRINNTTTAVTTAISASNELVAEQ